MQQQKQQQRIHAPPPPSASTHHAPSAMASAIHWAATKGDLRTLRQLVEYEGVDPSAKDASSHHCETPLFRAAGANHTEIIEYLLDYARVDVNQRDDSNHTALAWACYFPDNARSVAALLKKGADPSIATHDGRTPLMIAAYAGYSDIVTILLRAFDPSTTTDLLETRVGEQNEYHRGCTALLLAAHAKRWETVAMLLEEGADPTVEDAEGHSVLQLAKGGGAPRRLVHRIEHLIGDAARSEVLHKSRFLAEASQALTKAVLQTYAQLPPPANRRESTASNTPLSSMHERHARCLSAAPGFLKSRIARGDSLPVPLVVKGVERPWDGVLLEERAKAVAAHVVTPPPLKALGERAPGAGLPRKAYRMLMAMLVPKFVERRQDQQLEEALQAAAQAQAQQGRQRAGTAASSPGGEAAATVASEDDGVEESKGRGMSRERGESADVKQAEMQRRMSWQQQFWGAEAAKATGAVAKGAASGVSAAVAGGVEELDGAMGKLKGLGESGRGKLVRQLKAQQGEKSRRSIVL